MTLTTDPFNAFLDRNEPPPPHAGDGPLAGCTMAVKDIFDIAGQRTGGGNPRKLAEARPAPMTAPAVQALLDAGAACVGRTQTDELTFSLMGQNVHFPHPVNPAAPERVTGGSSSGSAAAVAAGLVDIALGSDTGGSIRAPASFCGLVGLRTTHGAIPLAGAMPLAPSFDTFGWFAKDIETYIRVAAVLLAPEPALAWNVARLRVMHLDVLDGLVAGTQEAAEYRRMAAIAHGLLGRPVAAPALTHSIDDLYWCFRRLQAHEAWAVHGAWISASDRQLDPAVRERFAFGAGVDAATRDAETARRDAFRTELAERLGEDGILVMPTVPGAAPLRDASPDDLQAYRERALRLLCLSGLSGFPQITLPLGRIGGAPFGLSLLGPAGSDRRLIALGRGMLDAGRER